MREAAAYVGPPRKRWISSIDVQVADVAVVVTILAVAGLFLISPILLEARGIAYGSSGGGILSKIHPSTVMAAVALSLRFLAARRPFRAGWRTFTSDKGVMLLSTAVCIAMAFAAFVSQTPITPLIDTFILPIFIFLLLRDLDITIVRWIALILTSILCVNAVMAIIEFAFGFHFIAVDVPPNVTPDPSDSRAQFDWRAELALDWRATALLGHPLSNGSITGCFILCLMAARSRWMPARIKIPILLLQSFSMFAFGARTSLVLTILFGAWLGITQAIGAIRHGAKLKPGHLAMTLMVIGAVVLLAGILNEVGFLDRTLERFQNDNGSATTRITMFNLFQPISWNDLFFGPDKDLTATWQSLEGLEFGIESSWIGMILIYGILVTTILLTGLAIFSSSVIRESGRGAFLVLLMFFIEVSVQSSMQGKTTTFAMAISLILIFLRKEEQDASLSPLRVTQWR